MPEQAPTSTPEKRATTPRDRWLAGGLLALTAITFWPVASWVTAQTFAHEQIKQSFFIMLMAGAWIVWERRRLLTFQLRLDNTGLVALLAAYGCVAAAILSRTPLLIFAGLTAAIAAGVQITFGSRALRRTVPLLAAFALIILFILLFPILDWPLRKMAGIESVRLLQSFDLASHLQIVRDPEVQLRLINENGTFIVETECNGFGLISSSLLLGTVCLLYRRARWWKFPGLLALGLLFAFTTNLLRIATIVLLAPRFPGNYHALHETAGIIALYTGLGAVWLLTGWEPKTRK